MKPGYKSAGLNPVIIYNFNILFIINFYVDFDFFKYYIKTLFILITKYFGVPFHFAPRFQFPYVSMGMIIAPVS